MAKGKNQLGTRNHQKNRVQTLQNHNTASRGVNPLANKVHALSGSA